MHVSFPVLRPRLVAFLLASFFLGGSAVAQNNTGLAFLRIGTSASALSTGSGQVAISADAFSTYWNPAGLGRLATSSAALTHHVWVEDTRIYTLAAAFKTAERTGFGIAVTGVGSGDIPAYTGPGESAGFFDAQFASAGAGVGHAFGPVSVGVVAKFLSERIFDVSANGYAVDFGVQVHTPNDRIRVGFAAQNFGHMSELNVQASELPRTLRAGVGVYPFRILTREDREEFVNTVLIADVSHRLSDDETAIHLGLGVQVLETIMIRGGWQSNNDLWNFSLGAGVVFDAIQFDYAYLPFQSGFGRSGHVLSLLYLW